jgi:tyrosine decarboxylase/aspartate 1-decarboxylase
MEQKGLTRKEVGQALRAARDKDIKFADGHILGSMITNPHEIALHAHSMFLESNLGNTRLYPGTKELEDRVIKMLSNLLRGEGVYGSIVNGGTEANITALWLAKKLYGKSQVIYPVSAHFSIKKAIDLLGLEGVPIGLDSEFRLDLGQLESKISEKTTAVIAMAGSTELGVIDPVEEIAKITQDRCFLHVDAAFGGMVIPFLKQLGHELPDFDFAIRGVDSIAVDPHKMGQATIPAGALFIREKKHLDKIAVDTPYLTITRQATLAGTRNSAAVAGAFAVMSHLGRDGYCKLVSKCMDVTKYFQTMLLHNGFSLVREPVLNIIAIDIGKAAEVEQELVKMNWWVSKILNPCGLRFVVMPHVTKEVVDRFIPDLVRISRKLGVI